jgi:MATE family multidrug resistance protein
MMAVDGAFFLVVSLMVGLLGSAALAAHQIVQNFGQIAYALAAACGDAAALRIGFRRGAKRLADARLAGFAAIAMSVAGMALMAATVFAFPEFFLGLFIDVAAPSNNETVAFALSLIPLASLFVLMDGLYGAGMGVLRGLNDTRFPMVLVGVVYWGLGLPIAYGLSSGLGLGLVGLWGGLVISLSLVGLALVVRYAWLNRVTPSAPGTEAGIVRAGTEAASVITPRDGG